MSTEAMKAARDALIEVREWIENWEPSFVEDDEWPETAKRMRDATYLLDSALSSDMVMVPREPTEEWQPIETAPKDGTTILGLDPFGGVEDEPVYAVIHWWTHQSYSYEEAESGLFRKVPDEPCSMWVGAEYTPFRATHWLPLPELPAALRQREGGGG